MQSEENPHSLGGNRLCLSKLVFPLLCAVLPSREVRPAGEVMGRKHPHSDPGPALAVSMAPGTQTLDSTFVSLLSPSPCDFSRVKPGFQRCSGDRDADAWCGVMGLTPLPTSLRKSLTSCLNCFPPGAFAQLPVTE